MARGVVVVLSPDDPAIFQTRWSHDWVAATLAWNLDLADIKQPALITPGGGGARPHDHFPGEASPGYIATPRREAPGHPSRRRSVDWLPGYDGREN